MAIQLLENYPGKLELPKAEIILSFILYSLPCTSNSDHVSTSIFASMLNNLKENYLQSSNSKQIQHLEAGSVLSNTYYINQHWIQEIDK